MNWQVEDRIFERFMDGASVEAIVGQDFPPIDEMVPSDMPYTREGTLAVWNRSIEQAIRNAIRRRERKAAKHG